VLAVNKIHHGDCFSLLDELQQDIIDCVVTSPPYNLGKDYGVDSNDDNKPRIEYMNWINRIFYKIYQKLKLEGSLFLNIGNRPSDQLFCNDVLDQLLVYFELQNTIIWVKSIDGKGHYKPIKSDRFLNDCFEYIFHLTKKKDVKLDKLSIGIPYTDKSNIKRWNGVKTDLRDRGNVWFIPYETKQIKDKHPAIFPVQLPEMCIKLHGIEKDMVVLDPFMGSGTVAVAAERLGVNYIGIELNKDYINLAEQRIDKIKINLI